MARVKDHTNGHLEEALAILIQNQAAFVARIAENDKKYAELTQEIAETNHLNAERFARIETILLEHTRILHALPDAIREKIGFKVPERQ